MHHSFLSVSYFIKILCIDYFLRTARVLISKSYDASKCGIGWSAGWLVDLVDFLQFLTEVAQRLLGPEQTINSQASVLIKGLLF